MSVKSFRSPFICEMNYDTWFFIQEKVVNNINCIPLIILFLIEFYNENLTKSALYSLADCPMVPPIVDSP